MRLIDADAAVDALRDYLVEKRCPDDGTLTCRLIENEVINKLPTIQPEIIRCKDCINYIDNRCTVADHHVAPFSCCQSVFQAKNRGEQE